MVLWIGAGDPRGCTVIGFDGRHDTVVVIHVRIVVLVPNDHNRAVSFGILPDRRALDRANDVAHRCIPLDDVIGIDAAAGTCLGGPTGVWVVALIRYHEAEVGREADSKVPEQLAEIRTHQPLSQGVRLHALEVQKRVVFDRVKLRNTDRAGGGGYRKPGAREISGIRIRDQAITVIDTVRTPAQPLSIYSPLGMRWCAMSRSLRYDKK